MTTNPVQSISDEVLEEIVREFDRNSPCPHESSEALGFGLDHRCHDCGRVVAASGLDSARAASDRHDMLSEALRGLIVRLKAAEVDSRRLDFMIREGCVIESQNGSMSPFVHRLYWRDTGEAQREWSATERESIDAAMERAK